MAATRFMQLAVCNHSSSPPPPSSSFCKSKLVPLASRTRRLDGGGGETKEKQRPATKACVVSERNVVVVSERDEVKWGWPDLIALLSNARNKSILILKKMAVKKRRPPTSRKKLLHVQMFLERAIMDCRFFTIFAVAGTLLASFLCFLEGCFLITESYLHYFTAISHRTLEHYQGHVAHLLIEALDMFLMGTGMLVFAMGLHTMFVGSQREKEGLASPNLSGLLCLKTEVGGWGGMKTVEEAKGRIGYAIMMMLQVGLMEKFNNIPLLNGMDMASFAAAVFLSSLSVFLLSKLSRKQPSDNNINIKRPFFYFLFH